jgi:hypothetical protein
MAKVLESDWGRLFGAWETTQADDRGYPDLTSDPALIERSGFRAFLTSLKVLWLSVKEAPEVRRRRRRSS